MSTPNPLAIEAARRLISGETGAFEELVQIYSPRLREGWARPVPCKLEPDDFAQETCLRCLMRIRKLRRPEDVEEWIAEAASETRWEDPEDRITLICFEPHPCSLNANLFSMGLCA
jgi:hypothetical protein